MEGSGKIPHLPSLRPSEILKAQLDKQNQWPTPNAADAQRDDICMAEPLHHLRGWVEERESFRNVIL